MQPSVRTRNGSLWVVYEQKDKLVILSPQPTTYTQCSIPQLRKNKLTNKFHHESKELEGEKIPWTTVARFLPSPYCECSKFRSCTSEMIISLVYRCIPLSIISLVTSEVDIVVHSLHEGPPDLLPTSSWYRGLSVVLGFKQSNAFSHQAQSDTMA